MKFHDRDAVQIENDKIRLTVLKEGGHIAELLQKEVGISPLWIPPWKSLEPSVYNATAHPEYGSNGESKLLAGLMGHNLCLDLFGPPSKDESNAGVTVHGDASVAPYTFEQNANELHATALLPSSALRFNRTLRLGESGTSVHVTETVENLTALDRPIAWTQHVTLGPPFLEHGVTQFAIPAARSRTFEGQFGETSFVPAADFSWPFVPTANGSPVDLRRFTSASKSAGFTTHLMDSSRSEAFFAAYHPSMELLFGYRWKRDDFPWLGIWEENRSRTSAPWNGETVALGMEFGASPFPETRRQMVERHRLFNVPVYRWLPAKSHLTATYTIFIERAQVDLETFVPRAH